jgi:hypothetical protein
VLIDPVHMSDFSDFYGSPQKSKQQPSMEKFVKSDQTVASLSASNSKNYNNNSNNNNNNNNPAPIQQKESDETTDRITKFFCDNATQISRIFEDDLLSPSPPSPPSPATVPPVVVQTDSFQQTQGPELNDSAIQTDEQEQQQQQEEDMLMVSHLPVPQPPPKEMNDNEVQTDEIISYPPSPPPSRSSPIPNIIPDNHANNNNSMENNNSNETERRLEDSFSMRSTIVEVSSPPRKLYEKETKKNDEEEVKEEEEEEEGEKIIQSQLLPQQPQQQGTNTTTVMQPEEMKISFMSFSVGDIALFVPIDEKRTTWMAFHSNRPYRFLAQVSRSLQCFLFPFVIYFISFCFFLFIKESLEHFLAKDKKQQNSKERSRILGRIVFIDNAITTEEQNPYHLPVGVCYYVCYVEPLLVPKKKI